MMPLLQNDQAPNWPQLLKEAVEKPGQLSEAYNLFYEYSVGNMLLAISQAKEGQLSPINTFKGWQKLGRAVKKGEKAIALSVPHTFKSTSTDNENGEEDICYTRFYLKRRWFYLNQTEGDNTPEYEVPEWNKENALNVLNIQEIPFENINGNMQGYAVGRDVAINPLAEEAFSTLIHEIAHIVLGHTVQEADQKLTRQLEEMEAEGTAYLLLASLNQKGMSNARAYIQHYWGKNDIPDKHARRIMSAASEILKAGTHQTR